MTSRIRSRFLFTLTKLGSPGLPFYSVNITIHDNWRRNSLRHRWQYRNTESKKLPIVATDQDLITPKCEKSCLLLETQKKRANLTRVVACSLLTSQQTASKKSGKLPEIRTLLLPPPLLLLLLLFFFKKKKKKKIHLFKDGRGHGIPEWIWRWRPPWPGSTCSLIDFRGEFQTRGRSAALKVPIWIPLDYCWQEFVYRE